MRRPAIERVLEKIEIDPNGCWLWTGSTKPNGYGQIFVNGRPEYVHRVTCGHYRGPLPRKGTVDHLCRVLTCCNPDHLEIVGRGENVHRGTSRPLVCRRGLHWLLGDNVRFEERPNGRVARRCMACHDDPARRA